MHATAPRGLATVLGTRASVRASLPTRSPWVPLVSLLVREAWTSLRALARQRGGEASSVICLTSVVNRGTQRFACWTQPAPWSRVRWGEKMPGGNESQDGRGIGLWTAVFCLVFEFAVG